MCSVKVELGEMAPMIKLKKRVRRVFCCFYFLCSLQSVYELMHGPESDSPGIITVSKMYLQDILGEFLLFKTENQNACRKWQSVFYIAMENFWPSLL